MLDEEVAPRDDVRGDYMAKVPTIDDLNTKQLKTLIENCEKRIQEIEKEELRTGRLEALVSDPVFMPASPWVPEQSGAGTGV